MNPHVIPSLCGFCLDHPVISISGFNQAHCIPSKRTCKPDDATTADIPTHFDAVCFGQCKHLDVPNIPPECWIDCVVQPDTKPAAVPKVAKMPSRSNSDNSLADISEVPPAKKKQKLVSKKDCKKAWMETNLARVLADKTVTVAWMKKWMVTNKLTLDCHITKIAGFCWQE